MSQTSYPCCEDLGNETWSPTPVWANVNDGGVTSDDMPPGQSFTVAMSPVRPPNSLQPETLTVSLEGEAGMFAVVSLQDLGGLIASRSKVLPGGATDIGIELTVDEAARIKDYTALSVTVSVSGGPPSCGELPGILYGTVTGAECGLCRGDPLTMVNLSPGTCSWEDSHGLGEKSGCYDVPVTRGYGIRLTYDATTATFSVANPVDYCYPGNLTGLVPTSWSPFLLEFDYTTDDDNSCCSGAETMHVTITE